VWFSTSERKGPVKHRIFRILRQANGRSPWDSREPVREELFSVERLEEHARSLAQAQPVAANPSRSYPLIHRLADNERVLLSAHRTVAKAIEAKQAITPAAEWLLDNFHIVEKQIRQIRSDLPSGYYRQLPKLASGPFTGYPRVLGVAWAFVAHADSRFDLDALFRYVRAYQGVQPLMIGELWALAITLRIVLVENLRRLADGIVRSRAAREKADALANRLLGAGEHEAEPSALVLAGHDGVPFPRAFAVQLLHRLRDQDSTIAPALAWLEKNLSAQGTTAEEVVRAEHQRQGAASVTMRNIITSMRLISDGAGRLAASALDCRARARR
jgi:cyclic beta-1,2-glucan synthetase